MMPIYETDIVDAERELYTTPAMCQECGDVIVLGNLDNGLCWPCINRFYTD